MAICEGGEAGYLGASRRVTITMTIKVLHLIDSGGLYGAEMVLLNLVEEQVKVGLKPLVLSAGTPDIVEKPIERAAQERNLPVCKWRMKAGLNLTEALKILRFAQREGVHVIHSHGYKFNLLMGIWPKSLRKIPVITTVHGYVVAPRYSKMWLYQKLDRLILPRIEKVVFVSRAMLDQSFFKDLKLNSYVVVNNGINIEAESHKLCEQAKQSHELISKFIANRNGPVIGAIGRLAKEKGYNFLLAAFKEVLSDYPDALLVIVGEGPERKNLEDAIDALEIKKSVLLAGFQTQVYHFLRSFDLYVMPSLTEAMPMGILEAMLARAPIIASAVGGIPECLEGGKAGVLVPPADVPALTNALRSLLETGEKRQELTEMANVLVRSRYSSKSMSDNYHLIYRQITGEIVGLTI